MKALIWIICIFINAFITTLLKEAGISGAIPAVILFGIMLWAARTLCKKWDLRKAKKQENIESSCVSHNNSKNNQFMGEDMLLKKEDIPSMQENTEVNSVKENSEAPNEICSKRYTYCSRCGSLIDDETKKCVGCGKQYFNIRNYTRIAGYVVLILGLILSLGFNIKQSHEISKLTKELEAKPKEYVVEQNNEEYLTYWTQNHNKLDFYDENIVFVLEGDDTYYYTYDQMMDIVEESDSPEFTYWAYNKEQAISLGYKHSEKYSSFADYTENILGD